MYCWPAVRARSTNARASNFSGLNRFGNSTYSDSVMPPGFGVMMGHEASTLASEYGPQCMNMPNLAFRYQAVRSSEKIEANAALGSSGSEPTTAASLRKSRRLLSSLYAR